MAAPKLSLLSDEKNRLRKAGIKISNIKDSSPDELAQVMGASIIRARKIIAMARFQEAPSIGPALAEKIVDDLEIYDLHTLKDKDGGKLFDLLEQQLGVWTDPCVEDQIRCLIFYAQNPHSDRSWFDFTKERKAYRNQHGYPDTRPKKAWYE
ncbi:hypothetical protein GCM10008986_19730 [Salinibacillus aidingensis]|uniref:Pathogenicity locus n=1 Tax=Salinibacillus aidingensis TaxID=237684 RepID=A0ABP3L6J5_9BACI